MIRLNRPLILGSSSPRRQYLMRESGLDFTVRKQDVSEDFPGEMPVSEVARYLAIKKAEAFRSTINQEIVVTADTVVILDNMIMNKPLNADDAIEMLRALSGRTHTVMTGVCILTRETTDHFDDTTFVTFRTFSNDEIEWYVRTHQPLDKAGAYGAQDWIGMVGIEAIDGSYFNVMGLPMHKLYARLSQFQEL